MSRTYGYAWRSSAPTSGGGKLAISLFFLFFLGMGLGFFALILVAGVRELRPLMWTETPCVIIASGSTDKDTQGHSLGRVHFSVSYRYRFDGQEFTSTNYSPNPPTYEDPTDAAILVDQYPAGAQTICYVNARNPSNATLVKGKSWMIALALFPLIFVAIGGGGLYFTWRRRPPETEKGSRAISERAELDQGLKFARLFFTVYFLFSLIFLYVFLIRPVTKIFLARNWPETPCTVLSSDVKTKSNGEGDTYRISIFYQYEFNGREYRGNRYDFMGGSSSGYHSKRQIVDRHPPGSHTVCYVNPALPSEAVLIKGFTPTMWWGLIPIILTGVGVSGMIYFYRFRNPQLPSEAFRPGASISKTARNQMSPIPASAHGAGLTLKPKISPWVKIIACAAFTGFWNAIVWLTLVADVIRSWKKGDPEWFLTIFMVPFVLVGFGGIGMLFYFILAAFNPRPQLTVSANAVPLGGELKAQWHFTGRSERIERLRIWLEGREEATYRHGTSTSTDKSVFARIDLAEITTRNEMRSGAGAITIPLDSMHSFASANNKIVWTLRLSGNIPRWPDVDEEFPITVLPVPRPERPST